MNPKLQFLPTEALKPSPTNPRRTFDEVKLKQLAESIAAHGVIEPVVVRHRKGVPHIYSIAPANDETKLYGVFPAGTDGNGPQHFEVVGEKAAKALAEQLSSDHIEIVAGERRWRASKLAKAETVPCIVRELTDREVLEIQVVENDQRDDLPPLDQARGYQRLIDDGVTADEIAAKTGRPRRYVHERIALLALIPEFQQQLAAGRLPIGHALVIARLTPADQTWLTKKDRMRGGWRGETVTLQHLQGMIRNELVPDLADAPWDKAAVELFAGAPACDGCPRRQKTEPELFDGFQDDEFDGMTAKEIAKERAKQDLCLDRGCFDRKRAAFIQIGVDRVKEKTGVEPVKISKAYGKPERGTLSSYEYEIVTAKEAAKNPEKYKPAIVAESENGELGEQVWVKVKPKKSNSGGGYNSAEQQAKWERERKIADEVQQRTRAAIVAAVTDAKFNGDKLWIHVFDSMGRRNDKDFAAMAEAFGLPDKPQAYMAAFMKADSKKRALMLAAISIWDSHFSSNWIGDTEKFLLQVCRIDFKAIKQQAAAAVDAADNAAEETAEPEPTAETPAKPAKSKKAKDRKKAKATA